MIFNKDFYFQEKFVQIFLTKEIIKDIEFEDCEFNNCNFLECKFERCKFINCKFDNSIVNAVAVLNSRFIDINFKNSRATGIDWTNADKVDGLVFYDCQINYSNFKLLKLPKIKIINCCAKEVDFSGCDLNEGIFTDTDFERSIFLKTNLEKADFTRAKNYQINIQFNNMKKAKFSMPEVMSLLGGLDITID